MDKDDFEALDPAVQAFLRDAVEQGEVYVLADEDGFALSESAIESGIMVLPVWSDHDAAQAAATDAWAGYGVSLVTLDALLEHWLPGLHADDARVGVNWDAELEGVEMPPLELQADLEAVILEADAEGLWDGESDS